MNFSFTAGQNMKKVIRCEGGVRLNYKNSFDKLRNKVASPVPHNKAPENFSRSLQENIGTLKKLFGNDDTLIVREFSTPSPFSLKCAVFFIESMTNELAVSEFLIKGIMALKIPPSIDPIEDIYKKRMLGSDVIIEDDPSKIIFALLSGSSVFFADGSYKAILADTKGYDSRTVTEPQNEKLLRGPREGFTEKITTNISLIRRRIVTTDLKFRFFTFGRRTNTLVAVTYLESLAKPEIVETLCERLSKIDIDGIIDSNYIEELICERPGAPFKTVGSTERPDTVASRLLEGRIAIIVNGTPTVLTVPFLFAENFQSGDDYYLNFIYANVGRLLRYLSFFLAVSVPAVYVALLTFHQQMMPSNFALSIVAAREGVPFPAAAECAALLLVFEILRETSVRMPNVIGQMLGIVGAIVIGESAVSAKIVSAPMVIVVGLTALTSLMVPRLKSAVLYYRLLLLFWSSIIGLYGYIFGCGLLIVRLLSMKSFGENYVSYFIAPNIQQMKDSFVRVQWRKMIERPADLSKDLVRQSSVKGEKR